MEPKTQAVAYEFTPAEFERLAAFRQAVLAGFYTDQLHDGEADSSFDLGSFTELMAAIAESDS
jgi:hypothetical protein